MIVINVTKEYAQPRILPFSPGDLVDVRGTDIKRARVLSVTVEERGESYRTRWFSNGAAQTADLSADELEPSP